MPYKGVIKHNAVILEEEIALPDGTPVTVIPESDIFDSGEMKKRWKQFNSGAERIFQQLLRDIDSSSDSASLLRKIREDRAAR